MTLWRLWLAVGGIFFANSVWAAGDALPDFSMHQDYVSTRALGMGNAFAAVVDDHSAIFYNPAQLVRRTEGNIHAFLGIGGSAGWADFMNGTGGKKSTADTAAMLERNQGKVFSARMPTLGIAWVRPKWGLAIIPLDFSSDLAFHSHGGPYVDLNVFADTTIAYSRAWDLNLGENNRTSVGATAKLVHRGATKQAVSAGALALSKDVIDPTNFNEGLTLDADVSIMYTPIISETSFFKFLRYSKPTFVFAIRNLADYGYLTNLHIFNPDSKEPDRLYRRIDIGSKFDLPRFWKFDPRFALDIRDITHPYWDLRKGLHLGFELYWEMYSWWKGTWTIGLNQMYPSFGFGARFAWFRLDLVTWADEVGSTERPMENRSYKLELSIDI